MTSQRTDTGPDRSAARPDRSAGRRGPRRTPVTRRGRDPGHAAARGWPARSHVVGAKNSALKLMAAALLAPGRSVITNVPRITDIAIMARGAAPAGLRRTFGRRPGRVPRGAPGRSHRRAGAARARRPTTTWYAGCARRSACSGPLLARRGHVRVAHPGGDAIGSRGLDMHVAGLARMGAEISGEHGFVIAVRPGRSARRRRSGWTSPASGATENLVMAAVLAKGVTEIDNAAREPEIVDICAMLTGWAPGSRGRAPRRCGSRGWPSCARCGTRTVGDRIVAGTWAFGAAMTRGDVTVTGIDPALPGDRAGQGGLGGRPGRDPRRTPSGCGWTTARPRWTW